MRSAQTPSRAALPRSLVEIAAERVRVARMLPVATAPGLRVTLEIQPDQLVQIALRVTEMLNTSQSGPITKSPYLTIAEAADYLRCRRERVHALLTQGRLTRHKDGGRTLVLRSELEAHVRIVGGLRDAA